MAPGANDLCPQVFGQDGMLFQSMLGSLPALLGLCTILEQSGELAPEGEPALRLDRDRDQPGVQAMGQPPGIADDLAALWSSVEAHQHAFTGRPELTDAVLGHQLGCILH